MGFNRAALFEKGVAELADPPTGFNIFKCDLFCFCNSLGNRYLTCLKDPIDGVEEVAGGWPGGLNVSLRLSNCLGIAAKLEECLRHCITCSRTNSACPPDDHRGDCLACFLVICAFMNSKRKWQLVLFNKKNRVTGHPDCSVMFFLYEHGFAFFCERLNVYSLLFLHERAAIENIILPEIYRHCRGSGNKLVF